MQKKNLTTLKYSDKLDVVNGKLLVNGKAFIVSFPDEEMIGIYNGLLKTNSKHGGVSYWHFSVIEGYYN